jgi:hypothetical protein
MLLAFGALAGCRARLPVDAPEPRGAPDAVAERSAEGTSRWAQTMRALGDGEVRSRPFEFELSPDRLSEVIRYRPYQPGRGGLLGLLDAIPVCLPHEHPR